MGNRVAYFNQTSLKFVSPPGICPVFLPLNFYFRVHRRKIFDIFQLRQLRMCPTNTRVFAVALNRRASVCPTARFDAHGIPFNVISTILTMLTCARVNVTVRHSPNDTVVESGARDIRHSEAIRHDRRVPALMKFSRHLAQKEKKKESVKRMYQRNNIEFRTYTIAFIVDVIPYTVAN